MIENPCTTCRGQRVLNRPHTLQVKVPPGVEDGTRILYSGHGNAGLDGGPAGDIYVVLHVAEHPFFERDGKDLHCAIPISFTQAALGAKVTIPTLEGDATLDVPEGTQTGTSFRVRKKGMPVLNSNAPRRPVRGSEDRHSGEAHSAAARIAGATGADTWSGE